MQKSQPGRHLRAMPQAGDISSQPPRRNRVCELLQPRPALEDVVQQLRSSRSPRTPSTRRRCALLHLRPPPTAHLRRLRADPPRPVLHRRRPTLQPLLRQDQHVVAVRTLRGAPPTPIRQRPGSAPLSSLPTAHSQRSSPRSRVVVGVRTVRGSPTAPVRHRPGTPPVWSLSTWQQHQPTGGSRAV